MIYKKQLCFIYIGSVSKLLGAMQEMSKHKYTLRRGVKITNKK